MVAELADAGPLSGGAPTATPAPIPTRTLTPTRTLAPKPTLAGTVVPPEVTATAEATPVELPTPEASPTLGLSATPSPTSTATATDLLATATPSPTPRSVFREVIVQPGDSLSGIASTSGIAADLIASANRLPSDAGLIAGQTLLIPTEPGVFHLVTEGDSASAISLSYGVAVGSIVEANDLSDAGLIFVGQRLFIPGGRVPTPSPVRPTATPTVVPATPVPPTTTRAPATPTAGATSSVPAQLTPTIAPVGRAGPRAPLRWPAPGGISQLFGSQGHTGIDIMADMGAAVSAAADGVVVVVVDSDIGYGKRVEVDHGGGMSTLYAHMSAFSVSAGQRVGAGQRLGAVGDTGFSFGPHLHFEVRLAGVPADPLGYLP